MPPSGGIHYLLQMLTSSAASSVHLTSALTRFRDNCLWIESQEQMIAESRLLLGTGAPREIRQQRPASSPARFNLLLFPVALCIAKVQIAPICQLIQECADGLSNAGLQMVFDVKHYFAEVLPMDDAAGL